MEIPTPEDFGVIKEFGIGIFGDLAKLDNSIMNDQYNGLSKNSAEEFKKNLLIQEQFVKSRSVPAQQVPSFYPPSLPQYNDPHQEYLRYEQALQLPPVLPQRPAERHDDGQLEFNLDPNQQEITNNLLKEISNKLTKLISLIQSEKDVTKLIVEEKRVSKVPPQFKETK